MSVERIACSYFSLVVNIIVSRDPNYTIETGLLLDFSCYFVPNKFDPACTGALIDRHDAKMRCLWLNMNHIIEIRSINLKSGSREEFHRLYIEVALPLLKRWNFDVVAHGPSLHDANSYFVIRRYDSLEQREQMEDAYYASDDWRKGPREAMLGLIESYTDIVFELDDVTVQGLRSSK